MITGSSQADTGVTLGKLPLPPHLFEVDVLLLDFSHVVDLLLLVLVTQQLGVLIG